jgi:hypothetical protein
MYMHYLVLMTDLFNGRMGCMSLEQIKPNLFLKLHFALTRRALQVLVGDVIYIEANSGAVKRVGRSDAFATEFDLEAEEYVPLPKGEVHKEIVQVCCECFCFCIVFVLFLYCFFCFLFPLSV